MPLVDTREEDDEVRGDMTPMIDLVFLLLVFFILTTVFIPEERVIAGLMPTSRGSSAREHTVEVRKTIDIRIWPASLAATDRPSELDASWRDLLDAGLAGRQAWIAIGQGAPLLVDGSDLDSATADADLQLRAMAQVHDYIVRQLEAREVAGDRAEQDPIVIHAFSGLPWKYALVVYDAVRYYEGIRGSGVAGTGGDPLALRDARAVDFAPPRVRGYHGGEPGHELDEIMHLR